MVLVVRVRLIFLRVDTAGRVGCTMVLTVMVRAMAMLKHY